MKTLSLLFIISFLSLPTFAIEKNITLSLGESHRIQLRGSPSIWIQNRNILKAEGLGSQLILKAQNEGRTSLRVGQDVYEVQILHPIKTSSQEEFRRLLKNVVGLSLQVTEGDLQITGNLYRLQDWQKIANFARSRHLTYQMQAFVPDAVQLQIQDYFQSQLAAAKLPPQTLIFQPAPEVRMKASELSAKKYDGIFAPFGIPVIRDESSLEIAPTVKVEITVAEVKKSLHRTFGVQWPSAYAANILPNGRLARDGDLKIQLDTLEENGDAKILASPNIVCRSGQDAEFLAGGEFPIKVLGYKSETVMWKRYGISLKVKPRADASGRMSLSIETEITSLDQATAADNIPGILTNKVSSHFDITKPQIIALSGLIKNDTGNSSNKGLPWLASLPVLGPLFSSKDFRENRSELVIFVRPTILKEESDTAELAHLKEGPRESRN